MGNYADDLALEVETRWCGDKRLYGWSRADAWPREEGGGGYILRKETDIENNATEQKDPFEAGNQTPRNVDRR